MVYYFLCLPGAFQQGFLTTLQGCQTLFDSSNRWITIATIFQAVSGDGVILILGELTDIFIAIKNIGGGGHNRINQRMVGFVASFPDVYAAGRCRGVKFVFIIGHRSLLNEKKAARFGQPGDLALLRFNHPA